MGNIGDPISQTIPAVGASGTTYATDINAFLTEVKERLEADVPRASLAAGNLDLAGSAVQNANYLGLTTQLSTPSTPNNSIQSYGNELYWVSSTGVVKITSAGSLNAAATHGITGDYGSPNPAEFRFVDTDQEYYAYDNYAGGAWAYLWSKGVDLAKNSTSTTRIRVVAPSALTSSYTLTLPNTPSADKFLKIDASGNITTVGTSAVTLLVSPAAMDVYSMERLGGKLWATTAYLDGAGHSPTAYIPLDLQVGDTLNSVTVKVSKESNASITWSLKVYKAPVVPFNDTQVGSTSSFSTAGSGGSPVTITLACTSLAEVVSSSFTYYAIVQANNAQATTDLVGGAVVSVSRAHSAV